MNSPAPDFLPQLARLAAGLPPPFVAAHESKPVERGPAAPWPQIDALLAGLAGLYRWSEDNLGPLAPLGGAQIESGHTIVSAHPPWSFNAEITFREPSRLATPAFVAVEIEVLSGAFDVAVLAADGGGFVGERHTQRAGRALVQLPVFDQPVRGVVFRNAGVGETGGRMRVLGARLAQFDPDANATAELRRRLEAEAQNPSPPEVDAAAAVPATLALGFHRLLAEGRIHEAARWLAAIDHLSAERPAWIDLRLSEILVSCHSEPRAPDANGAAPLAAGDPPPSSHSVWPDAALAELAWLRGLNRGAELIPLHQEILQALATLDLLSVARPCRLRFRWERSALAATPVRDGALSALCAQLLERIREADPWVEVDVRTTPAGTTLEFHSPLDAGALQYRAHSMLGDEWHRALHDPRCPLPLIEHRLGAEGSVRVTWAASLPAASLAPLGLERADLSGIETLYSRADGHGVRVDGGICYKLAPPLSAKPNDLVAEAALQCRAGAHLAPEALAAIRTPAGTAMSYRFVPGIMLLAWAARQPAPIAVTRVLLQLTSRLAELNRRGVQHRDVRAENVLVGDDGAVRLLDFDQARATAAADDFGNEWATEAVCCGFGGLLGQLGWRASFLRTAGALGFAWELGRFSSANSPGKHSCYYDWRWGGFALPGERPWYQRWDLLRPVFEHRAPRGGFLELGCNLGLLSTHASVAGWQARGVDHNALAVTAAGEIARALGVAAQFQTGNLCDPALFAALGDDHDLVSALSVVHWLPDPAPVEAFLRRQRRLLFEGHRAIHEEISYLHSLGYEQVELLGYSERLRPLFYATRISP